MTEHNTSDPILVLIRRGRNGRGFSVSPVEDISNPALCADVSEIGEVIVELLNDPNQPRVDMNQLLNPGAGQEDNELHGNPNARPQASAEADDVFDDEFDEEPPVQGDLADRLIFQGLTAILGKGRSMSSSRVRPSGPRRKRKKA